MSVLQWYWLGFGTTLILLLALRPFEDNRPSVNVMLAITWPLLWGCMAYDVLMQVIFPKR